MHEAIKKQVIIMGVKMGYSRLQVSFSPMVIRGLNAFLIMYFWYNMVPKLLGIWQGLGWPRFLTGVGIEQT
ncbi:hypothetical protein TI04_01920 [Achromatium sp. WMS2]|nr:hypothetical protein TI04_01920 [Achromatium sp. WMS2]